MRGLVDGASSDEAAALGREDTVEQAAAVEDEIIERGTGPLCRLMSGDQQQLADGTATLYVAMRLGGIGQRIGGADLNVDLAADDPVEQAGTALPE